MFLPVHCPRQTLYHPQCFPRFYKYDLRDGLKWRRFSNADRFIDLKKKKKEKETWQREAWVIASFGLGALFLERLASVSSFV